MAVRKLLLLVPSVTYHKCLYSQRRSLLSLCSSSLVTRRVNQPGLAWHDYRLCAQLSSESQDFASLAAKLPRSYIAKGAKTAIELSKMFEISPEGFLVKNKKTVNINAKELLDFLVTTRKTSLNPGSILGIAEDLAALKIPLSPNVKKIINEAIIESKHESLKEPSIETKKIEKKKRKTAVATIEEKMSQTIKQSSERDMLLTDSPLQSSVSGLSNKKPLKQSEANLEGITKTKLKAKRDTKPQEESQPKVPMKTNHQSIHASQSETGTILQSEKTAKRTVAKAENNLIESKAKIEVIKTTGAEVTDTATVNTNNIARLTEDNLNEIKNYDQKGEKFIEGNLKENLLDVTKEIPGTGKQELMGSAGYIETGTNMVQIGTNTQLESIDKRKVVEEVNSLIQTKEAKIEVIEETGLNTVDTAVLNRNNIARLNKDNIQEIRKSIQQEVLTSHSPIDNIDEKTSEENSKQENVNKREVEVFETLKNENSVGEEKTPKKSDIKLDKIDPEGSLLTTKKTISEIVTKDKGLDLKQEMQKGKSGTANDTEILQNLKEADRKVDELEVKSIEKTIAVKKETGKDNTNGGSINKDFWKIALGVGLLSSLGFFYSGNAEPEAKTPAREDELKEDNTEYEKCTIADTILYNEDDKDDIVNKQLGNINAESKVEKQPEELKDHNENDLESCMDTPNRVCDKKLENSIEIMDGNNSIETNANIEEIVTEAMDTTIVNTNNIARLTEDNLNEIKKFDQKEEKAIEENIKEKLCGNEPNDTNPSHIENLETSEKDVATFMKIAESMLEQDRDISTEEDKFDQTEEQQEAGA
eukprot:GFUD01035847.1.p1 GENE.GFUD01035847.1~~GFUD01035847.1.p1  ORF type:complete len:817 (+),score=255.35 GFUD01035847.1:1153-3603(+)